MKRPFFELAFFALLGALTFDALHHAVMNLKVLTIDIAGALLIAFVVQRIFKND